VFTKRGGIIAQTAQVRVNYADEAYQMKGNGFASRSSRSTATASCPRPPRPRRKRAAVDTTTVPAYTTQAVPPIRRGDLYLSFLAGGGAIADFGWTDRQPARRDPVDVAAAAVELPRHDGVRRRQAKLTGTIPKRIAAAVDIDAVMAATTFAARPATRAAKTIAATSYPTRCGSRCRPRSTRPGRSRT
jgi:hypothetical protein